jgi:hypothetical protein
MELVPADNRDQNRVGGANLLTNGSTTHSHAVRLASDALVVMLLSQFTPIGSSSAERPAVGKENNHWCRYC